MKNPTTGENGISSRNLLSSSLIGLVGMAIVAGCNPVSPERAVTPTPYAWTLKGTPTPSVPTNPTLTPQEAAAAKAIYDNQIRTIERFLAEGYTVESGQFKLTGSTIINTDEENIVSVNFGEGTDPINLATGVNILALQSEAGYVLDVNGNVLFHDTNTLGLSDPAILDKTTLGAIYKLGFEYSDEAWNLMYIDAETGKLVYEVDIFATDENGNQATTPDQVAEYLAAQIGYQED